MEPLGSAKQGLESGKAFCMSNEANAMRNLRTDIALQLVKLEERLRALGVPMDNLTLIARDPANDNVFICVTNENPVGLLRACGLALGQQQPAPTGPTAGAAAFAAYREHMNATAYDGTHIPEWHEVAPKIREGWEEAAYVAGQWYAPRDPLYVAMSNDQKGDELEQEP
jgi:hypothetical protein